MLDSQPGMKFIAEAGNGLDATDATQMHNPDIVIMDINIPGLNGIDATKQLLKFNPDVNSIAELKIFALREGLTSLDF